MTVVPSTALGLCSSPALAKTCVPGVGDYSRQISVAVLVEQL
jgi:hypothetical protein